MKWIQSWIDARWVQSSLTETWVVVVALVSTKMPLSWSCWSWFVEGWESIVKIGFVTKRVSTRGHELWVSSVVSVVSVRWIVKSQILVPKKEC